MFAKTEAYDLRNKPYYAACVSPQSACEQIVKTAACIAADEGARLTVVSVLPPSEPAADIEFIDQLQELSLDCSADLAVIYSASPAPAIMRYFKVNRITHAVIGSPAGRPGFGHDVIRLCETVMPRDLNIIQLPGLCEQQIASIDVEKASEISLLYARKTPSHAN